VGLAILRIAKWPNCHPVLGSVYIYETRGQVPCPTGLVPVEWVKFAAQVNPSIGMWEVRSARLEVRNCIKNISKYLTSNILTSLTASAVFTVTLSVAQRPLTVTLSAAQRSRRVLLR